MEIQEYVTFNFPERTLFSDAENSCSLIIRDCRTILKHDTTYHDSLQKSYNTNQMKVEFENIIRHFHTLSDEIDKIIEFKKSLEVKS